VVKGKKREQTSSNCLQRRLPATERSRVIAVQMQMQMQIFGWNDGAQVMSQRVREG
jgi:hypothetical protein